MKGDRVTDLKKRTDEMKKTVFAVTDPHGCASALKAALREAGFDRSNPTHLLVVCGDYFDRGKENRAVFVYLDGIKNKVLIRGNHEDSLERIMRTGKLSATDRYNGTDITVREFFRGDYIPEYDYLYTDPTSETYRELNGFLREGLDYFETENYIFTHGWLPVEWDYDGIPTLIPDWRHATALQWYNGRWTGWNKVYPHRAGKIGEKGKTVVCGHRSARYGSHFDTERAEDSVEPFFGEGVVALDAFTVSTGRVNVLRIENEEVPDPVTHEMSLRDMPFNAVRSGVKRIEMRLFDEKRQRLRLRDRIAFRHAETGELYGANITGLYRYADFFELARVFPPEELGFPDGSAYDIACYMKGIYGEADIKRYGALAIQID